jgi:hypothetical protein
MARAKVNILECPVESHGPFATSNGAAFHATWCAEYRKAQGIADDAPGVRQSGQREAVTLESVLSAMTTRSAPVSAAAAETVVMNGVTLNRTDAVRLGLLKK